MVWLVQGFRKRFTSSRSSGADRCLLSLRRIGIFLEHKSVYHHRNASRVYLFAAVTAETSVVLSKQPRQSPETYFSGSAFLRRGVAIRSLLLAPLLRLDFSRFEYIIRQIRPRRSISSFSGSFRVLVSGGTYARRWWILRLLYSGLHSFQP